MMTEDLPEDPLPEDPPPEDPPEDTRDRSIRIIATRVALLERAIRREFSGMGRTFGGEEFDRLWKEAEEEEPDAEVERSWARKR